MSLYLFAHIWIICLVNAFCKWVESSELEVNAVGCQHKSTSGRAYMGEANTTVDGIPCQKWSDTHPHKHGYTHVGDHNFCRNPDGTPFFQVWCYTADPNLRAQTCSVPFCPPLKAIDVSLDNDDEPDVGVGDGHR